MLLMELVLSARTAIQCNSEAVILIFFKCSPHCVHLPNNSVDFHEYAQPALQGLFARVD